MSKALSEAVVNVMQRKSLQVNAETTSLRTSTTVRKTPTSAFCDQECEEGWTAGPGIYCFKFIDAAASKEAANWTYLHFDRTCTEIGQSQAYLTDFKNDDIYQLFSNLRYDAEKLTNTCLSARISAATVVRRTS